MRLYPWLSFYIAVLATQNVECVYRTIPTISQPSSIPTTSSKPPPIIFPAADDDEFKALRLQDDQQYFIDTSLLIKEIMDCNPGFKITIIARPPKYGKTVNMNMLQRFLKIPSDENELQFNRKLFFGGQVEVNGTRKTLTKLRIADYANITDRYFGEHPVISLNFRDCGSADIFDWIDCVNRKISQFYSKCELVREYRKSNVGKKLAYQHYVLENYINFTRGGRHGVDFNPPYLIHSSEKELQLELYNLHYLIELMYKYYGKTVVVLLDDLDYGINEAFLSHGTESPTWKRIMKIFRDFFQHSCATFYKELERMVVTTLMPVRLREFPLFERLFPLRHGMFSEFYRFQGNYENSTTFGPLRIFDRITNGTIVGEIQRFKRPDTSKELWLKRRYTYELAETRDVLAYLIESGYLEAEFGDPTDPQKYYQQNYPIKYARFPTVSMPERALMVHRKINQWIISRLNMKKPDRLFRYLTQLKLHSFSQLVEDTLREAASRRLYGQSQRYYVDMLEALIFDERNRTISRLHPSPVDCDERLDLTFVHTSKTGCVMGFVMVIQLARANDPEPLTNRADRALRDDITAGYEAKLKKHPRAPFQYVLKMSIAFRDGVTGMRSQLEKTQAAGPSHCEVPRPDYLPSTTLSTMRDEPSLEDIRAALREVLERQSKDFQHFIQTKLPIIDEATLRDLEIHLYISRSNRLAFKRFLKSKDTTDDFNQTIHKIMASVIHPDARILKLPKWSNHTDTPNDQIGNFVKNYSHVIGAVVEVVYELHNDAGIVTLMDAVQRLVLRNIDTISDNDKTRDQVADRTATIESSTSVGHKMAPKIRRWMADNAVKWIGIFKSAFANGTAHFHRKLKTLLGIEKNAQLDAKSSESRSESDESY